MARRFHLRQLDPLAAAARPERLPCPQGNRIADEVDRAVYEADVDAAGMITAGGAVVGVGVATVDGWGVRHLRMRVETSKGERAGVLQPHVAVDRPTRDSRWIR